MPDIFYLLSKWWKQILLIILLSLAVVGAIVFILPPQYLSTATSLPASSYLKDKASIFNTNIQQLYPALGIPDDLDMIVGTGQLDTAYIAVTKEFNLYDHYKTEEQGEAGIIKAAYLLKKNSKVIKSDFGELKVKVWDTDKNLAPQLANAIMNKLNSIHQDIENSNNVSILSKLEEGKENLQTEIWKLTKLRDSVIFANKLHKSAVEELEKLITTRSDKIQQYEKLIIEYQLMVDSKPPVLIVVEKARASNWPDKPKKLLLLTATFVLSLLFSLLLVLLLEKRKSITK